MEEKTCTKCKKVKSVSEFHKRKRGKKNPTGYESSCKQCRKDAAALRRNEIKAYLWEYNLRTKYGLSLEAFDAMWEIQDGRCAICHRSMTMPMKPTKNTDVNVDHSHAKNRVRGLLCVRCNRGIGYFEEDVTILLNAVEYIQNR